MRGKSQEALLAKLLARIPVTVYETATAEGWDEGDWKRYLNSGRARAVRKSGRRQSVEYQTILLIVLIVILLGGVGGPYIHPGWGYGYGYGNYGVGGIGLVVVIILILVLLGRF